MYQTDTSTSFILKPSSPFKFKSFFKKYMSLDWKSQKAKHYEYEMWDDRKAYFIGNAKIELNNREFTC